MSARWDTRWAKVNERQNSAKSEKWKVKVGRFGSVLGLQNRDHHLKRIALLEGQANTCT